MIVPSTLDDLKRIVAERLEETTRLEFKRQLPESGKNDDLARDLQILANTEGGVIVYGIEEEDGRAKALNPIDLKGAPERVSLVSQQVDEPVPLTSVFTIEAKEGGGKGFLVVEVPRSDRAPHFYKGAACSRAGRATVALTRRQIGELFARSPGFAEEFGVAPLVPEKWWERPGAPTFRLDLASSRPGSEWTYEIALTQIDGSDIGIPSYAYVHGDAWTDFNPAKLTKTRKWRLDPLTFTPAGRSLELRLKFWWDGAQRTVIYHWPTESAFQEAEVAPRYS